MRILFKSWCTLSLIILFGTIINAQAQTTYPSGVYRSLSELRSFQPTYNPQDKISVVKRTRSQIFFGGGNEFKVSSESDRVRDIRQKWYAYSDGSNLYVNGFTQMLESHYCKVLFEGKYIVFEGGIPRMVSGASVFTFAVLGGLVGGFAAASVIATIRHYYALDITTGRMVKISARNMRQLLSKFPDLEAEFRNELDQKNDGVLLHYIQLLNQRFEVINAGAEQSIPSVKKPVQAKYLKRVDLIVYRTKRKELSEPIHLIIDDSNQIDLVPNSFWKENLGITSDTISVCNQDKSACISVDFSKSDMQYIKCSMTEKNPSTKIELMRQSTGEWDFELVQEAQQSREKKQARAAKSD